MPGSNGTNESGNLAKEAGKTTGKAIGKVGKAAGKKAAEGAKSAVKKLAKTSKNIFLSVCGGLAVPLAIFMVILFLVLMIFSVYIAKEAEDQANASIGNGQSLQQVGTFYPRLEAPQKGKLSVNMTDKHVEDYYFNNTNPLEAAGYGMPNCTAYAWSRAYEMLDSVPNLCVENAQRWYDYNKQYDYYPYGNTPRLGAIAVWSHPGSDGGESGHVAVVEKIEGTKVTFSNSAWQGDLFFLKEVDFSVYSNYWDNSTWTILGFIYVFDEYQYLDSGAGGSTALAAVAKREVEEGSHYGGQKYWSWYGFNSRVEWCACFTSYCMNKCGLLTEKAGGGHRDAQAATSWYKQNGQFLSSQNTPSPGMLIFYDWEGDGIPNHIGIVIDVKNNTIHTAEGNTYDSRSNRSNSTGFHEYPVGSPSIYGFATFGTNESVSFSSSASLSQGERTVISALYPYFKQRGYSKAAICGILGNIYAECAMESYWYFAKYVPDAGGASGNSGGICMWYEGNCDRFKRDCPNWNTSLQAQVVYLAKTLDNDGTGSIGTKYYYGCTGCKAALQSVPNTRNGAQLAAQRFMNYYERPNMGFDQSDRWIKAAQYWDALS